MQIHQFSPGLSSYHPAIPLTVKSLFHLWALFIIRGDRRFHFRRDEIILITMEPTCPFSSAPLRSDHSLILSSLWVINLPCLLQPAPALPRHITPLPSHTDHHIFTLIDNLSPLSAHFNAIGALALGPWNLVVSIVFVICESRTLSDQFFFSTGTHEANRYSYRSKALIDRVLRFWGIPQYLPVDRLISRVREFNKLPSMFLKKKTSAMGMITIVTAVRCTVPSLNTVVPAFTPDTLDRLLGIGNGTRNFELVRAGRRPEMQSFAPLAMHARCHPHCPWNTQSIR